jgi:endogenous inhibitor of DNA gyrase (YacG/DUF329 family)
MPKTTSTCEHCGKTIEFYPSQKRRFCSKSCQSTVNGKLRTAPMPVKPKTGRFKPCERCGTEFWVMKSGEGRRRFCSRACNAANQTKPPIVKVCVVCGKEMALKPSQAEFRGQERFYCSRECMGLGKTKRPLGRLVNGKPARLDDDGYVWVWAPHHPESGRYKGWMAEHRIVAEQHLGRPLTRKDEVHHVNRVKDDNRPENLQVLDGITHSIITAQQRLTDRELIAEYRKRFGVI